MPLYERRVAHGARRGRYLVVRTATELLTARRAAAISQRELGRQIRVSHTKIGKAERGEPDQLTIELSAKMLAPGLQFRTEVPIPIEGERRSADAVIDGSAVTAMVEAETRIDDVQALERRLRAKQRALGSAGSSSSSPTPATTESS